jgi:hypothetical protein
VLAAAGLAVTAACGADGSPAGVSRKLPNPAAGSQEMPGMTGGVHRGDSGSGLLATEAGYTLKLVSAALKVGSQKVTFQIRRADGQPQTEYVQQQTQPLHLYLIRLDLSGYQHVHPTLKGSTWTADLSVVGPGPYRLYTEFVAKSTAGDEQPLVLSTLLQAPGRYAPVDVPAPSATTTVNGLTATISGRATAGRDSRLSFTITSDGKEVADLEPYLDSYAHLTAVRLGDAAYQHLAAVPTSAAQRHPDPAPAHHRCHLNSTRLWYPCGYRSRNALPKGSPMLMNRAEKAMLNNPARRALQRHYEAPLLTRLGADVTGARVLEVGCGEGAGAHTLLTRLGAAHVTAIDLDPAQVARARRRLRDRSDATVQQGDVTQLPMSDASVEAVADFGIIPRARLALRRCRDSAGPDPRRSIRLRGSDQSRPEPRYLPPAI